MKKLLYLLLFFPLGLFAQTQIVNVGTTANDGTGDPLRTAFQKVNTNTYAVQDSFGNIYRESQTRTLVNDSLNAVRAAAVPIGDYAFLKANANTSNNAVTLEYLESYGGGGGVASRIYTLKGRVGVTTGIPENGDSLIIHSNFIGKYVDFWREGQLQSQHTNNTVSDGYHFNSVTGTITTRPVMTTNEEIEVWSTNTIIHEALVPEGGSGGGGSPPATPLLDSLLAYYDFDEVSGTVANDALGVNNGTTNATLGSAGKLGNSFIFDGSQNMSIPYSASLLPADDEMTFACWFKVDILPSVAGKYYHIARFKHSVDPFYMASVYISPTTNYIAFEVINSAGTTFSYETANGAVAATGTWYYIACVNEGTGVDAKIYLGTTPANIADVTSYHPDVFTGDLFNFNSYICIGNHSTDQSVGVDGNIDEVAYYNEALTLDQIKELAAKTYPFE